MAKKPRPRRLDEHQVGRLIERLSYAIAAVGGTAQALTTIAASLERTAVKREAQAVIDALLPDVRELLVLTETTGDGRDGALRAVADRIARRLAED